MMDTGHGGGAGIYTLDLKPLPQVNNTVSQVITLGRRLVITDDGVGLHPLPTSSQLLWENHLGVIGMQERARLANGRLTITSGAEGGLTVEAVFRVDAPEPR